MRHSKKLGFAAVLLAGSALTVPSLAQESPQPKLKEETQRIPSDNAAKKQAPGQQKAPGEAATETAPGRQQKSGEAGSAAEVAPGQTKPMKEGQASEEVKPKTDDNAATKQPRQTDEQAGGANQETPGQPKQDQSSDEQPSNETTASVNISAEQQTQIKTIIQETKVAPAKVDVDINVGVIVPTTVEFHPLPPRVVEIVPRYTTRARSRCGGPRPRGCARRW